MFSLIVGMIITGLIAAWSFLGILVIIGSVLQILFEREQ